jgi:hypothetical protein
MKRPSLHRVDLAGAALARIPVNPDRVNAAFAKFLSTGQLPDDLWVAPHIPARLRAHPLIERGTDTIDWQATVRALLAGPPPAEDKVVDALLDEAIFGVGLVRMAARSALVGLVRAGFDLRQPIFDGVELPEFGTVGWALLGFPQNFVAPHHAEQCERLELRCDILARAIPHDDRQWWRSLRAAADAFQASGELPDDDLVLECVLALGEWNTFARQIAGGRMDEELAAFDTAFMATEGDREPAIARLQELAAAGRFLGEAAR